MADQARVSELESFEYFRASLIVFINDAQMALDAISDEVRRTRGWLQQDRRSHWEQEIRKRNKLLDLAEQELMTARLSNLQDNIARQQMQVKKARARVEEAEEKMRAIKKWTRDFDSLADPLVKRLDTLNYTLSHDLPKAVAFLLQAQKTLEDYLRGTSATPRMKTSEAPPAADGEQPAAGSENPEAQ